MPRELRHRPCNDVQRRFLRRSLASPGRRDSRRVQMKAGATRTNQPKHAERLAKGLPKTARDARTKRRGKGAARARPRRHAGGAVADARSISPIVRLIQSLGEEKIRFQIVGMAAAILQGVVMTTLDTDIWVELAERQYIRLLNMCVKQGATALSPTVYVLADGRVVNFLFRVDGIRSFAAEYPNAISARL